MADRKWMPGPGQLERVAEDLSQRHEGEEINYSSCSQNGCFEGCVLRTHVKDGRITAIETDDTIHVGYGREDAYADPDGFRKGLYQRRACTRGRGWRIDAESSNRILYHPENIYYLMLAKDKGIPIVTIDPRYTWTAEVLGSQHIFIRPGTDLAMIIAMCYVMFEEDLIDHEFVDKWVEPVGLEKWKNYVMGLGGGEEPKTPEWAEVTCGVPAETIREFTRFYASKRPAYMRLVWAAARQIYGKQIAMGFNCLQAFGGNLGKKGCSGTSCSYGSSWHVMQPYTQAYFGDQPGEYGAQALLEAETWDRAVILREKLDAGEITEEYYRSEIGVPPDTPLPNCQGLLVSTYGDALTLGSADDAFRESRHVLLGRGEAWGRRPPRPFDIRHTFYCQGITGWHEAGLDVCALMPLLSACMGHDHIGDTCWYLSNVPDLMPMACRAFGDTAAAEVFSDG